MDISMQLIRVSRLCAAMETNRTMKYEQWAAIKTYFKLIFSEKNLSDIIQ